MGPMLAPWILLSRYVQIYIWQWNICNFKVNKNITWHPIQIDCDKGSWICRDYPYNSRLITTQCILWVLLVLINSSPPGQNGCYFADNIFRCIFMNEKFWILIKISPKFVPKGPIGNNPVLVWIMAWHRSGDKPLSEAMLIRLPRHLCVTLLQWVNFTKP